MVLGPGAVSVACVRRAADGVPRVTALESVAGGDAETGAALDELVAAQGLEHAPCVAVLRPGSYSLLQVEAPDVEPAELRAAIRWRIKDLIDYHLDDAVIDAFEVPGQSQPGRPRMMYAVAARSALVQRQIERLAASGLELTAVDISELALRNLAAQLPEAEGSLALLFLTADTGLVALTHGPELCLARSLEVGGRAGVAHGTGALELAAEPLHDTLALEIQRSLDYFDSFFSLPPVSSLMVAPTAAASAELVRRLDDSLSLPARLLEPGAVLACDVPLAGPLQADALLALGGALRTEPVSL